jgi:hypothetical protein
MINTHDWTLANARGTQRAWELVRYENAPGAYDGLKGLRNVQDRSCMKSIYSGVFEFREFPRRIKRDGRSRNTRIGKVFYFLFFRYRF